MNNPFGTDEISAKAKLRIDVVDIDDGVVSISITVVPLGGLPELSVGRHMLKKGESLTVQNVAITLAINIE